MATAKRFSSALFILPFLLLVNVPVQTGPDLNHLSGPDIKKVEGLLAKLAPLIKERREKQNLATLTFEELYAPLKQTDRKFLQRFQSIDAKELNIKIPFRGIAAGKENFVTIKGQKVTVNGKIEPLPPQFLTREVYQAYTAMMNGMQKDIGKRLYVESGYRSSAYQLYLFVSYA